MAFVSILALTKKVKWEFPLFSHPEIWVVAFLFIWMNRCSRLHIPTDHTYCIATVAAFRLWQLTFSHYIYESFFTLLGVSNRYYISSKSCRYVFFRFLLTFIDRKRRSNILDYTKLKNFLLKWLFKENICISHIEWVSLFQNFDSFCFILLI